MANVFDHRQYHLVRFIDMMNHYYYQRNNKKENLSPRTTKKQIGICSNNGLHSIMMFKTSKYDI